jgi:predicted sulfurtransferase
MKALEFLRQQGFKYVKSVKGGIDAWSDQIDRGGAKYWGVPIGMGASLHLGQRGRFAR